MKKLVLIDGNSIMNRAFYGIMGSKTLTSKDGKYTNAIYGFLAILFKILEEEKPEYLAVTFDLKGPTKRHELYEGYKANRHGMPNELAEQMPIIKDILRAMNIDIIEKEGYEGDDILGTLSVFGEKENLKVIILSGDRDTFQLATDNVEIHIPRTKAGKTETEIFDRKKVEEVYGIKPKQLIEVKGLQGDSSDNIPGVPGIGEKTALSLIQKYKTIDNLYKMLDEGKSDLKGKQKEKIEQNRELAYLSKTLGTINTEAPIEYTLDELKVEEWDKSKVLEIFKNLNFKRYIERFDLEGEGTELTKAKVSIEDKLKKEYSEKDISIEQLKEIINTQKKMIFCCSTEKDDNPEKIIKEKIVGISVFNEELKESYYFDISVNNGDIAENKDSKNIENVKSDEDIEKTKNIKDIKDIKNIKGVGNIENTKNNEESKNAGNIQNTKYIENIENVQNFKEIFENEEISKIGINLSKIYILLMQEGIELKGIKFDCEIAAYILNPTNNNIKLDDLIEQYMEIDVKELFNEAPQKTKQLTLFEEESNEKQEKIEKKNNEKKAKFYSYAIYKIKEIIEKKLEEINATSLFNNIDMPTVEVLSNMQWNGMYANKDELNKFGDELKKQLEIKQQIIYEMAGCEFNINSTKQLGEILFEKLGLPVVKKTKSGYSTDVDVLEKLKDKHPIITEILDYRQYMKLNSTYVEGLKPYINPKTKRIHSFFHQTITATGRISSTEPNLQNIPTRFELGKQVRRIFEPDPGKVYIDADYSQIELRVLAHISGDEHMIQAFKDNQDIHKQAASKVFKVSIDEVTKEQRTNAKAVNFGIVYGISDFGLAGQLGISRKQAKEYIDEYLTQYIGIKNYMSEIVEIAKETGYVETLFNRRRYIPELKSNNYMVRQFGTRVAMNTPIQGTAADIMKIAMINVLKELQNRKMKSKIVLQVHDEMMIEAPLEEKEEVKKIVKEKMESAIELKVPLIAEISEAQNWYECK